MRHRGSLTRVAGPGAGGGAAVPHGAVADHGGQGPVERGHGPLRARRRPVPNPNPNPHPNSNPNPNPSCGTRPSTAGHPFPSAGSRWCSRRTASLRPTRRRPSTPAAALPGPRCLPAHPSRLRLCFVPPPWARSKVVFSLLRGSLLVNQWASGMGRWWAGTGRATWTS